MGLFKRIYKQILSESNVSDNKIAIAIDKHQLVVIRYNTHGERVAMANRLVGVFAYGLTKRGNPCIRVFEYKGDTTTFVPGWKLIRLDRILSWHETNKTFEAPPVNTGVGEFNPNGDNSMSQVFKVAQFGIKTPTVSSSNEPITADKIKHGVSKQSLSKSADQAKKIKDGTEPYVKNSVSKPSGPKMTTDINGEETFADTSSPYYGKRIAKTDSERALDYLRKQLDNPQKIELDKKPNSVEEPKEEPNKQSERPGLDGRYSDKPFKKADSELAMDYLRKQLENPETIDLDKFKKR